RQPDPHALLHAARLRAARADRPVGGGPSLPVPPPRRDAALVAHGNSARGRGGAVLAEAGPEGRRAGSRLPRGPGEVCGGAAGAAGGPGRSRAALRGTARMVLHVPVPAPPLLRGALRGRGHLRPAARLLPDPVLLAVPRPQPAPQPGAAAGGHGTPGSRN